MNTRLENSSILAMCNEINEQTEIIPINTKNKLICDKLILRSKEYLIDFNHIHLIFSEITYKPLKVKNLIKQLLRYLIPKSTILTGRDYTSYIKTTFNQLSNVNYFDYNRKNHSILDEEHLKYLPFIKYASSTLSFYRYQLMDNELYLNVTNNKYNESKTMNINRTNIWYSDLFNHYAIAFRGTKTNGGREFYDNAKADFLIGIGKLNKSSRSSHILKLYYSVVEHSINNPDSKDKLAKISLTGHSLGGSLAAILNQTLCSNQTLLIPYIVYTYNRGIGINPTAIRDFAAAVANVTNRAARATTRAASAAASAATSAAADVTTRAARATTRAASNVTTRAARATTRAASSVASYMPSYLTRTASAAASYLPTDSLRRTAATMTNRTSNSARRLTSSAQDYWQRPTAQITRPATQPPSQPSQNNSSFPCEENAAIDIQLQNNSSSPQNNTEVDNTPQFKNQINYYIANDLVSARRSHTSHQYHNHIIEADTTVGYKAAHVLNAFLDHFQITTIFGILESSYIRSSDNNSKEIEDYLNMSFRTINSSISPEDEAEDNDFQNADAQEQNDEINQQALYELVSPSSIIDRNRNNADDWNILEGAGYATKMTNKRRKTSLQKNASKKQNTSAKSKSSAVKPPTKKALNKPKNITNTYSVTSKPAPKTHKKAAKPTSSAPSKIKNKATKAKTIKPVLISKSKNDAALTTSASNKKISVSTKQPKIHLGKRGGQYYLKNGNKIYV